MKKMIAAAALAVNCYILLALAKAMSQTNKVYFLGLRLNEPKMEGINNGELGLIALLIVAVLLGRVICRKPAKRENEQREHAARAGLRTRSMKIDQTNGFPEV
jgi:hypothetical protein